MTPDNRRVGKHPDFSDAEKMAKYLREIEDYATNELDLDLADEFIFTGYEEYAKKCHSTEGAA
jgi:hypothetical protein